MNEPFEPTEVDEMTLNVMLRLGIQEPTAFVLNAVRDYVSNAKRVFNADPRHYNADAIARAWRVSGKRSEDR